MAAVMGAQGGLLHLARWFYTSLQLLGVDSRGEGDGRQDGDPLHLNFLGIEVSLVVWLCLRLFRGLSLKRWQVPRST